MGKPLTNHGIKYLSAVSFFVFIWFTWRLSLHPDAQETLARLRPSSSSKRPAAYLPPPVQNPAVIITQDKRPKASVKVPAAKAQGGRHPDVLDEAAAAQFCSNFRLEPFPRDRVVQRKIYDLLLINTELEMLEVRMGQMSPGVDYFVILESDKTFTDKPKPLYVSESWDRFAPWHHQMIRRTMDLDAASLEGTWAREDASRNAMFTQVVPRLTGAQAAREDDVLLVSDVDEMFKPHALKVMRNCAIPERVTAMSHLFYYSFQWVCEETWAHPQATVYRGPGGANTTLPGDLRRHGDGHFQLREAAWHCSYCFSSVAELVKKITSFSHTEFDKPEFKDPEKIVERVQNGYDIFDRTKCQRVESNPDVPNFLRDNQERFGYMLNRDPDGAGFKDYPTKV